MSKFPTVTLHNKTPQNPNEKSRLSVVSCRVLMGLFTAVQPVADLFMFMFPLYYTAKVAFAVYLWSNNLSGAEKVYKLYVEPSIREYEPMIDKKLEEVKTMGSNLLSTNFTFFMTWLRSKILQLLAQQNEQGTGVSFKTSIISSGGQIVFLHFFLVAMCDS